MVWREWRPPADVATATLTALQPSVSAPVKSAPALPTQPAEPAGPPAPVVAAAIVTATTENPPAQLPPLTAQRADPLARAESLKLSLQLSALVAERPAVPPPVKAVQGISKSLPRPATAAVELPVRSVAADETVLAARSLWNDGARPGALATLREALDGAEKARNNRAAAVLARELARMEVADNRAQVARDLLKRLEPLLSDDADAWALRGNAEQRLALHTEAAASYLTALRMRSTEGKWMLGAAISLAASGKLEEAQVWVDRARERDAVTPTIAAYLQQLGIVARR
jgi:tetratricopeptide (TPR) repeat protein